jgi:hypothetical protein
MDTKALIDRLRLAAAEATPNPPPRDSIWELTADYLGLFPDTTSLLDTASTQPLLEVAIEDGQYFSATPDVWDSWTGARRRNGEDYHGPVYYTGTRTTYTGKRGCPCITCSETTLPHLKYD